MATLGAQRQRELQDSSPVAPSIVVRTVFLANVCEDARRGRKEDTPDTPSLHRCFGAQVRGRDVLQDLQLRVSYIVHRSSFFVDRPSALVLRSSSHNAPAVLIRLLIRSLEGSTLTPDLPPACRWAAALAGYLSGLLQLGQEQPNPLASDSGAGPLNVREAELP